MIPVGKSEDGAEKKADKNEKWQIYTYDGPKTLEGLEEFALKEGYKKIGLAHSILPNRKQL